MPMNAAWLYAFEYGTGRWRPEIGDPSVMGWATVAAYGACAVLAFWAARVRPADDRRCFWFWVTVGLLMAVLAVNKQLDLQTLFTDIGRQVARHQGWIEQRRTVQFWFIVFFGILAVLAFLATVFFMRNLFRRFMLAFIGLFLLLSFIVIRAASFHHFDEILHSRFLNLKVNWILELTGIFIVLAAAARDLRRSDAAGRSHRLPQASGPR